MQVNKYLKVQVVKVTAFLQIANTFSDCAYVSQ